MINGSRGCGEGGLRASKKREIKRRLSLNIRLIDGYIEDIISKCKKLMKKRADLGVFKDVSIYPLYAYIFIILKHINDTLQKNGFPAYAKKTVSNIRNAFAHPETLKIKMTVSMDGYGNISIIKKQNKQGRRIFPYFKQEIITFESKSGDEIGPWYIKETYFENVRDRLKKIINKI